MELQYVQHLEEFTRVCGLIASTEKQHRHWLTLHLHAAGLCSCRRLIFFPSQIHQAKPITTHTIDST